MVKTMTDNRSGAILPYVDAQSIRTFAFNDTVLIIWASKGKSSLDAVCACFKLAARFFVESLERGILFRGSLAIGSFYIDEDIPAVMGQAVTDAAAWYNQAEWIGVQATPRASLMIEEQLARGKVHGVEWMVDYDVPLKGGRQVRLKAINWPEVSFAEVITPCNSGERPRQKLLEMFTSHQIPCGQEAKYCNTLKFFDFVVEQKERTIGQSSAGA